MAWHFRRFLGAAAMFVAGIGMAGFTWARELEAASWMADSLPMTYEAAAAMYPGSSIHPICLVTLFIPDFFGLMDSRHVWGAGYAHGEALSLAFTGGMFVTIGAMAAALYWIPRRATTDEERALRTWTWIATLMLVLFLLASMGRYTPVFRWLCAVLPWFFRFPHAAYYMFVCSWCLAILAGIGIHGLMTMSACDAPRDCPRRLAARRCWGLRHAAATEPHLAGRSSAESRVHRSGAPRAGHAGDCRVLAPGLAGRGRRATRSGRAGQLPAAGGVAGAREPHGGTDVLPAEHDVRDLGNGRVVDAVRGRCGRFREDKSPAAPRQTRTGVGAGVALF
jgi:hypothetical protein